MSLSAQTQRRLPTIKRDLLLGLTSAQIGDKLGVTEKTIDRDLKAFINSGEFESWIKEEWLRLHNIILHEDPVEAYRNISKLVSHMMTRKVEKKVEITERVDVDIRQYELAIERAVNRSLHNDTTESSASQQVDSTQPNG